MTHTHHVIVGIVLSVALIAAVGWMLAYYGIYHGRKHDRSLSPH